MIELAEKIRAYVTLAFAVWLLFVVVFYLCTAIHVFTDEEIVGNNIIRYKEFYIEPLFSGEGFKYKFNKQIVGWASEPYFKTEGGETHDLGNGISITDCTVSFTTRDKHYYP